ncbi:hypothetical protein [Agrobacterium tumefaciens]|uniref:hypothetical protein n=1 Tax=Agrobacterium tumefaciens TaxID=358 RepID=UPI002781D914|nr:hypothetical protein [Agrobacterium tumefaciens]MDP9787528.1 hypothetical protein [Agrobacterium tumefaciens]
MLPETMFLMEKMRRTEALRRQGGGDDEWETWPSSAMDRLAVFLFHLPLSRANTSAQNGEFLDCTGGGHHLVIF